MRPEKVNYALIIRRFCLVLLDIVCVLLSSLLAIATRFEFSLSQIPVEFYSVLVKLVNQVLQIINLDVERDGL